MKLCVCVDVLVHVRGGGEWPKTAGESRRRNRPVRENGAEPVLVHGISYRVFCTIRGSHSISVALVLITNRNLYPHACQSCPKALMARGSQNPSLVSLPDGIFCADGQPWVCRHAAGAPHGVVYDVHFEPGRVRYLADMYLQISLSRLTVRLMTSK